MPLDQSDIQSRDINTDRTNEINVKNGSTMHNIGPYSSQTSTPSTSNEVTITVLAFSTKCLHVANLNFRHLLSKFDEIGGVLASENGPDILRMCETFLDSSTHDDLISVTYYDFLRKDRSCTINKAGGGVILYYRDSINCRRKTELEISNIETLWSEITSQSSKP